MSGAWIASRPMEQMLARRITEAELIAIEPYENLGLGQMTGAELQYRPPLDVELSRIAKSSFGGVKTPCLNDFQSKAVEMAQAIVSNPPLIAVWSGLDQEICVLGTGDLYALRLVHALGIDRRNCGSRRRPYQSLAEVRYLASVRWLSS